jgi:DNA-binding FadR family transcriptional regulator
VTTAILFGVRSAGDAQHQITIPMLVTGMNVRTVIISGRFNGKGMTMTEGKGGTKVKQAQCWCHSLNATETALGDSIHAGWCADVKEARMALEDINTPAIAARGLPEVATLIGKARVALDRIARAGGGT